MGRLLPSRRDLDDAFPTAVRYAGLVVMLYSVFVDHFHNPGIATAATGMIFFKTVLGRDRNGGNGKNGGG